MMEDISKSDIDRSEETVEEEAKTEGRATDATTGDAGSVTTDVNADEHATAEPDTEEKKPVVDASATVETAVVSEDDEMKESVTYADAADDVAFETAEVETNENKELEVQTPDETMIVVTSVDVEEKSEAADAKDATTDRVEHVTSKADKVTVSVEMPEAVEVSEEAVVSSADTADAAAVTKSETSDTVNKTTQDVTKMAGNDELKFGVLIGLVHVGQFSNKDVVDSVLCLVSSTVSLYSLRAGCRNARLTARLANRRLTCGRVARSTVSKPLG